MPATEQKKSRSRRLVRAGRRFPFLICACVLMILLSVALYFSPTLRARFLSRSDSGDVSIVAGWCVGADLGDGSLGTVIKGKTEAVYGCRVQSKSETAVSYQLTLRNLPRGVTAELYSGTYDGETVTEEDRLASVTAEAEDETLVFEYTGEFEPCPEGESLTEDYSVRFTAGSDAEADVYDDILFGVQFTQKD